MNSLINRPQPRDMADKLVEKTIFIIFIQGICVKNECTSTRLFFSWNLGGAGKGPYHFPLLQDLKGNAVIR